MVSIDNEILSVSVDAKGAELQNIFLKEHKLQYLWNGNAAFWPKKSPVLFPIVGTLKKNTYFYQGRSYQLSRHGFARDMEFETADQTAQSVSFRLSDDENTLRHFPFSFQFTITYSILENQLTVTYRVKNISDAAMYFSVGGHPAFRVPLVDGTAYSDYFLAFNEEETLSRWPISPEGLIEKKPEPFLQHTETLVLSKELFYKDALVFKFPASSLVSLQSDKTRHGLDFDFSAFPYLGIWAAKNADFVCIEPWCGIADSVDSDQQIISKEGINKLGGQEIFEKKWSVTFY
jgi:galactose mutarotase-like enzyme